MINEEKYFVYKHITPEGKVYIGRTKDLKGRWRESKYVGCSLYPFIEKHGWDNIQHIVVAEFDNKEEACLLEDKLIMEERELGRCINKIRSGLIENDKQKYGKQYYIENKEILNKKRVVYYEKNKDIFREKRKKYYENNKEKERERGRKYYQSKKQQKLTTP